jgi:hypothetical protein
MRSALARRHPTLRAAVVGRAARPAAVDAPLIHRAPAVIRVGAATSSFLLVYAALTFCHAVRRDPQVVVALARIPLFARVLASAIVAASVSVLAPRLIRDRRRALRVLPALLGASIVLTVTAILWFA